MTKLGVEEKSDDINLSRDLCGLRRTAGWTLELIVIPPGGARDDVRVGQPDLGILEAAEIAGRLRERVREFPQAEGYSADELLALCTRLRETIKLREPS